MDQKTKHTPGPWVVDEVSEDEAGQETLGICAEEGGYVAGIHCGPDTTIDEQDKANAHLIAAAPAMYQELVKQRDWLLHIMKQVQAPASVMLDFEQSIKYLNLTIAQAEGIVK